MDSFKGTLTAVEACEAVARGWRRGQPDADIVQLPVADGGDGTAEALKRSRGGRWVELEAAGPLPERRISTRYLWLDDAGPAALIEMAEVNGLTLLSPEERDPLRTSTRGTGELIAHALARGARTIWLTLGGSATVDGGLGMARALGWQFIDEHGREVPEGGGALNAVARIVPPRDQPWRLARVRALCDVDHPLVGPRGAAAVFGPQKGADAQAVRLLDSGLRRLAALIRRDLGIDVQDLPGAGAAGGLGAGAVAFLEAELVRGVDVVLDAAGFSGALERARLVVTGEGRVDDTSFHGKLLSGVVERARRAGVPTCVIGGRVDVSAGSLEAHGIQDFENLTLLAGSSEAAMRCAADTVERSAEALARRDPTAPPCNAPS